MLAVSSLSLYLLLLLFFLPDVDERHNGSFQTFRVS